MGFKELLDVKIGEFSLGSLFSAMIIFLICLITIRILTRLALKALGKSKMESGLKNFVISCLRVTLWIIAVFMIADALGIPAASLVAVLSVAGLALSLSLQSTLTNVFSGFTILFTKPFISGDFVDVGTASGTVRSIGLFYTTLVSPDNKEISIPNGEVSASKITNYSREATRRVDLAFGLGYGCPVDSVRGALLDAARADARVLDSPEPAVVVAGYKNSRVEYSLRVWVATADYWDVYFSLNEAARAGLENAGMPIAFDRIEVKIVQ